MGAREGGALETIRRAEDVLLEPKPGGAHDDHAHVRVACSDAEVAEGCEPNGPDWPWFMPGEAASTAPSTDELVLEVSEPIAGLTAASLP